MITETALARTTNIYIYIYQLSGLGVIVVVIEELLQYTSISCSRRMIDRTQ